MTEPEIDAEVFRILRAKQDLPAKAVCECLAEQLPELTSEQLRLSLARLRRRLLD